MGLDELGMGFSGVVNVGLRGWFGGFWGGWAYIGVRVRLGVGLGGGTGAV